jgi:predicted double-glycine peptidase
LVWPSTADDAKAPRLPEKFVMSNVPYVQQMTNYCGPASLTSVLNYWGTSTDQKTVGKGCYDAQIQATNGADMMLYARSKGFSAYSWNSDMNDLKTKLADGVPVIVLQDISLRDTSGHYRVITGYDSKQRVFYMNDPYEPMNKWMNENTFSKLWSKHGNWALLVCPPEKDTYKVSLDEKNPVVHIDLAYIYYKRGNAAAAEKESRLALALEPANYSAKSLLAKATAAHGSKNKSN